MEAELNPLLSSDYDIKPFVHRFEVWFLFFIRAHLMFTLTLSSYLNLSYHAFLI